MPQVLDNSVLEKAPKAPGIKKWERSAKSRPHLIAPDGLPAPTSLEIMEGEAWKRRERKNNDANHTAWGMLHWRLHEEYGSENVATTRCEWCGVLLYGRCAALHGCANCGHKAESDR